MNLTVVCRDDGMGEMWKESRTEHLGSHGDSSVGMKQWDLISKRELMGLNQFHAVGKKERAIDDLGVFNLGNWETGSIIAAIGGIWKENQMVRLFLSCFTWG